MILSSITELSLVGVFDRGVANLERIVIRANIDLNLGQFGIMLGYRNTNGLAIPYNDHLFWFGDGVVKQGEWLIVYTGQGQGQISEFEDKKVYTVHWGKPTTVLAHSEVLPILFRADAVTVAVPPLNLPQGGSST